MIDERLFFKYIIVCPTGINIGTDAISPIVIISTCRKYRVSGKYSSCFAGYQIPIRLIFVDYLFKDISCSHSAAKRWNTDMQVFFSILERLNIINSTPLFTVLKYILSTGIKFNV